MLKNRLLFGTIMIVAFTGTMLADGWMDGSLTPLEDDDVFPQATLLCIIIAVVMAFAQLEMTQLASRIKISTIPIVSVPAVVLFATSCYWCQWPGISAKFLLPASAVVLLFAIMFCQYLRFGTENVIANCGAACFSVIYVGFLSGFLIAIRLRFGLWALAMLIFVVKSADIGAYAVGTLLGKHKFSPAISPAKTWEGMIGGLVFAVLVAVFFALFFDIMRFSSAVIFGVCFAFAGQLGDLAESMIKRDAEQKDAADNVPGFGGILDVIDSLIPAAPAAFLFMLWGSN